MPSEKNKQRYVEVSGCAKSRFGDYLQFDEKTGFGYCTFFGVDHQYRRVDCTRRLEEIIHVEKGEGWFTQKLPYYRCIFYDNTNKKRAIYDRD